MKRHLVPLATALTVLLGLILWPSSADWGTFGMLIRVSTLVVLSVCVLWGIVLLMRRLLWRVSRRLAFSYLLIGVLPIPLVIAMFLVVSYILSGYFVGHLYRDAWQSLEDDLRLASRLRYEQMSLGKFRGPPQIGPIHFVEYRHGVRITPDPKAPERWDRRWPSEPVNTPRHDQRRLAVLQDQADKLHLMVAMYGPKNGVFALWSGDLALELSQRSGVWVELFRPDDPRGMVDKIAIFGRELSLKPYSRQATEAEVQTFFNGGTANETPGWLDRSALVWMEIQHPFFSSRNTLGDNSYLYVNLTANLPILYESLISHSAEIESNVVIAFIVTAFILFDIYAIALLLALLIIFGLSRAVDHLTDATERMRQGDFSTRITVQRRDQIGALQNSFNSMASNLQDLVAEAAQKEILEKDLSIARELQHSLLPDALQAPEGFRFATHFEPSSAIGGDYYDFIPMGDDRLGIVVADVSGHGLPAGLRMAMVKSALQVLADQQLEPVAMLQRLDHLLRHGLGQANRRSFVTATLAVIDREGHLVLTNAGHPPTYLLRHGEPQEILLPSPPLGALGADFCVKILHLEPGDLVLWLSDGIVEATNHEGEDFGYDRVLSTLAGMGGEPAMVRDRLLDAVDEHTGDCPIDDDRTLVVMAYKPAPAPTFNAD